MTVDLAKLNAYGRNLTAAASMNDPGLGSDWLSTDLDVSNSLSLARDKRAASMLLEDSLFNMTEVASQTIAADQADIGDSWTFDIVLDLPGIAIVDKSDITVELFGLDPDYGRADVPHTCDGLS